MTEWLALAASPVIGGAAGYTVSALRATGRRRGQHRRLFQKAPRPGPHKVVPVKDPNTDDAPTEKIPVPGGGARIPEGEQ
ncbi:hypothetical protein [Streptomyces sp. NRRL S-920]|uniref:hypothetical protein n=1 Tax=Streptomyces sp. NRRL S-920 TaxID=1463921 RepID=UPI000A9B072C|nr:hypothetical protein [Streptomyces sp. NRRL S-920]